MGKVPEGSGWYSEIRFDGNRFLAWKTAAGVKLMTRNGLDWADRLPAMVSWIADLPARSLDPICAYELAWREA